MQLYGFLPPHITAYSPMLFQAWLIWGLIHIGMALAGKALESWIFTYWYGRMRTETHPSILVPPIHELRSWGNYLLMSIYSHRRCLNWFVGFWMIVKPSVSNFFFRVEPLVAIKLPHSLPFLSKQLFCILEKISWYCLLIRDFEWMN